MDGEIKRHVIITRDRSEGRREEVGHERRSIVNEAKLGYTPGTVTRGTSLKRVSSDQFDTNGTSLSRVDKDKRGKGGEVGRGNGGNNRREDKRKARPRANNASNACLDRRRGKWKQKEQRAGWRADKDWCIRGPPPPSRPRYVVKSLTIELTRAPRGGIFEARIESTRDTSCFRISLRVHVFEGSISRETKYLLEGGARILKGYVFILEERCVFVPSIGSVYSNVLI